MGTLPLVDADGNLIVPIFTSNPLTAAPYKDRETFDEPTWRIALDHQVRDDTMIYASYSRGFKSGVYNMTSPTNPVVEPEILDVFEIGAKMELLDNRLRLNTAAFYYQYDQLQVTIIEGAANTLLNAAEAEVTGVDLEFVAALTESLTLTGGGAWLDATYKDFQSAPFAIQDPSMSMGTPIIIQPGDASGNNLIQTPELSLNLALDYFLATSMGQFRATMAYAWRDEYAFEPDQSIIQESYGLLNASLGLNMISGSGWSASLWGRNLTDEEYLVTGLTSQLVQLGQAGAPRTYGVTVSYEF
tara:strand:+ start:33 stop:935 length:903 start_codon:yes stop_codon:yes gene_type:complete